MHTKTAGCFGSTNRLLLKSLAMLWLVLLGQVGQMCAAPVAGRTHHLTNSTDVPEGLVASEWSSIRAAYTANRHTAFPLAGGHLARNPGQRWRTEFDGRGFTTRPDAGGWQWGLELRSYGFSGQEQAVNGRPVVKTEGQRVTYAWSDALQEWFVNDARGLEHGFTVNQRPTGATMDGDARLQFTFTVRGGLRPEVSTDRASVSFVDAQKASVVTYGGLKVWDADGKILPSHFSTEITGLCLTVDERGARYPLTIDPIAQQAYLKASNTDDLDWFGGSVAVSGNVVVVGASGENSNATGVNGNQSDNSAGYSGAAYVFVRTFGVWNQQAYLKASNTDAGDAFGGSVSVSGEVVVVGAHSESSNATGVNHPTGQSNNSSPNSGAAYVFVRNGNVWSQQAYLKASNTGSNDYFGGSVAVSGDTVVVGAYNEDSGATGVNGNQGDALAGEHSGAAYIFVRNGTTWSQQAYVKASNTGAGDHFGGQVGISGDTVVVAAINEASAATGVNGNQNDNSAPIAGAVYVFARNGATWNQQAYLKASNTGSDDPVLNDGFGVSVAVSADTIVVGAKFESSSARGVNGNQGDDGSYWSGAAYIFARSAGVWSQQAYLKASNADPADWFGASVGVSGDTVVVGAPAESSSVTGVSHPNGQSDNSATNAGAAYVFRRSGTTWTQQVYLKASNTRNERDEFGGMVAVSGDTVVVGSQWENSDDIGINGDGSNTNSFWSGAAYIFTVEDSSPPTIAFTTPATNASYVFMPIATGTAADNSRVREVRVALVRSSDLFWWNFASNTWGNTVFAFDYTVKIATGTTNWSASLPSLPPGGYQVHAQSVDIADLGSPWSYRNFTIETGTTVTLGTDLTNWRVSTTIETTDADSVPWPGVTSLPEVSTFTDIPTEGAPHVTAVPGAANFASDSSVKFFRSTFTLPHFNTLAMDIRASFDNDLQIFINGHELALEGNYTLDNFAGPNHRILVNQDGSINNGYEGGQVFSTSVATNFPSSFFQTGSNEVVLALRNNNGGDAGGVAFRADFVMTGVTNLPGPPVVIKNLLKVVGGAFGFDLVGPTTNRSVILTSTNLADWTPIQTNLPFNGTLNFRDPSAIGLPHRFYQIWIEP